MAARLDLVLVNPGNRTSVYQALGSTLAAIEPPVWAGLMATYVRRLGFSVRIIDANAEDLAPEQTADAVADLDPRLAAVVVYGHNPSASTQVMPAAAAICTALRQRAPSVPSLLVGGHVAALPEHTLREEDTTFVCGGEGPVTLAELLEALRSSAPNFGRVRGLWYRDGDRVVASPPAPLVRDPDTEMPGPAWDLLPMPRYRAHNWHCFGDVPRQPYVALYTTLGCPYHCSFCCIQAPFKTGEGLAGLKPGTNSYRFWSPATIVAELERLVREHGVRNVKIADEMFVLTPRHVGGICDAIGARGLDLNIWAYARVDTVRDGMVDRLARAGFRWLAFGIEAASERVRADVDKAFTPELMLRTLEHVRAAGINIGANYIFGLPEDDAGSMRATLDLALELNAEYANFYCAMAYPGSSLYRLALDKGWPLPERWSGYSQHSAEVLRFRDQAFQAYFTDPRYLAMVERRFGLATVEHIREMTAHRLVRRHA
jgi:anaerobic magnesium-protoporphyrin IX monomethyl ester cyclase